MFRLPLPRRRKGSISRHRLRLVALLAAVASAVALAVAVPAQAIAAFAARASLQSAPQYINDPAGADLTFTIQNTGGTASIGAVEIDSPGDQEVVSACPSAPAGWSTQVSASSCRYLSTVATSDDIAPGASSSAFQVHATNVGSVTDYIGTWSVIVSKSNSLDTSTDLTHAFATGAGLKPTAFTWEITDAVVASADATPGSACPSSDKSAAAGSTGNVIVICGHNHSVRPQTPAASASSLGGTFIGSHGTFSTARIAANSANIVIGNWDGVAITSTQGTGKTVVAEVSGSYLHQTSPTTTLSDYVAANGPPVATDDNYGTNEDVPLTVVAPGVLGNDSDPNSDLLTAVIVSSPSHGAVTLNANGGFTYTPGANYNGSDSFTYQANDGTDNSNIATVTLTITAVNDAPSFDLPVAPDQSVSENAGAQTVSGFATNIAAGPTDESAQTVTFHVSNDNNSLFTTQPSIDPSTGDLTYTPATNATGSATVSVYLTDDGGTANGGDDSSATQTFTIMVATVNQAPSFSLPPSPNQTVLEDAEAQTVTGFATNIVAGPPSESGQTLTFHVSNDNNALFSTQPSIDPTTGNLTYTSAANANGSTTVSVYLTDNGGTANGGSDTSATQTFTITVTAVNDPPTFSLPASPNQSVAENAGAQTVNGFASGISAGPPNESGQTLAFHVSNDNNALFSTQPSIDVTTGTLTYTPVTNAIGSATVTVFLEDNGGTANGGHDTTANKTFTITVTLVNHAPSFSLPGSPNQSVLEDAGAQTVNGFATSISAGPPNESTQTLTFHVSNDNNALFSVQPSIDPTTGNLTYTPAANANGSTTVSVYLTDNGGTANGGSDTSATQTFTITVTAVNDAPVFSLPGSPNQSVLEDAGAQSVTGFATAIAAGPGNESGQTLTFHVSNDNNALFSVQPSIDPTTGNLTYTSAANVNGSSSVSVYLTDNGGTANGGSDTSATQTFTITVTAVNDAPSFSLPASPNQTALDNAGPQTISAFATNILAGPANEAGQTLTFHVSNDNNAIFSAQPSIDVTTGDLTYTPLTGQTGTATVSVYLSDNGGTANGGHDTSATKTFTISITASDSPPTDIQLSNSSIAENSGVNAVIGSFTSTDVDAGDTHAYTLVTGTGSTDNASFNITAAGVLQENASFNFEVKSSYSIRVRTTDNGGLFFEKAFTITVTDVNEAPTDIAITNASIAENSGVNAVIGTFSSTDPDAGGTHAYTLVTGTGSTDNASFNITAAGVLQENASFNFEVKNSYSIRVRTTDNGGLFFEKAFTITVTDVNEAPTDIAITNASIAENSGVNAVIGSFTSTDVDAGDTHAYTLVTGTGSTDNASFNITAAGVLQENASFNFEAKNSYSIRVRTTDNGGLFFEKAFTITVTDVNEAPTDIAITNASIAENSGVNAVIGPFSSTDPDAGGTHAYTLVAGTGSTDNASFNITAAGVLQENASFNFEVKNSYSIRVRTTDNGGLFFEKAFTITVTDVNDAPVAVGDSYSGAIGNTVAVLGTTATGPSVTLTGSLVIANDTDEDTGVFAHALSAVPETVSSTGGGSATITSAGAFTFTPGVGDKNQNDTFTYHVTDGTLTTAGTVTVHIDDFLVWYVDSSSSASTHDGRSSSPFTGLTSLNGANGAGDSDASGDIIFVYRGNSGTTPYAGGIPLEATESLIGQTDGLVVNGHTLVAPGASPPVLTNSVGAGIALANGVNVQGISVTNTAGAGILGVSTTTATVGTAAPVTISGAGAGGVSLTGAAGGDISIAATISGNTGHSIQVSGRTSGTVAFSGAITDGSGGIALTGNTGATINLTGGLTANTGSNAAFTATGGGTVSVTGSANTLVTTTGTALDVENTSIGASGLVFKSIAAVGGAHGIVLLNTGASGGLTVTGAGAANSGGTINGIAGADVATNACASLGTTAPVGVGVYLLNTTAPSFSWMNFTGTFGNFGILGYNVNGFNLDHTTMTGTFGNNVNVDEDTVHFCTLTGSATLTSDTISNGAETNLRVVNASGTLNRLTMSSDTMGLNQSLGGDGTLLEADGGTLNATVQDSTFLGSRGSPFQAVPQAGATMNLVFGSVGHGNTIHNTHSNIVPFAQDLNVAAGGNLTFDINSNHFDSASAVQAQGGVFINAGASTAVASGYFRNNTIGNSGVANSGSSGNDPGLDVESNGGGDLTISITNNQMYQWGANGAGFLVQAGATLGSPTTFNVTATGNTIAQPGTFAVANSAEGFQLNNGTNSGENFTTCLNFASNTANGSGTGAGGDIRIRQRFDTKVQLPGYAGAASGGTSFADIINYIKTKDPTGPPSVTAISSTAAGGGFFNTPGGAPCATPSF